MTENTNETPTPKLTEEQALEKFKAIYNEIYDLERDIKEVAEQAKDSDLDVAGIKEIAKAIAYCKLGTLADKFKSRLDLIERVA